MVHLTEGTSSGAAAEPYTSLSPSDLFAFASPAGPTVQTNCSDRENRRVLLQLLDSHSGSEEREWASGAASKSLVQRVNIARFREKTRL